MTTPSITTLRRRANTLGYVVEGTGVRDPHAVEYGRYRLITETNLNVGPEWGYTPEELHEALNELEGRMS